MVKKIEIREPDELEPMLVAHPEILEEGLKVVDHQLRTPTGPLDILAVDEDGALAVIELKNEVRKKEDQLLQALRYYDWCFESKAQLAHHYKGKGIDPQKDPKIILVAPDFSEKIKRLAKYLLMDIELYRYQAIELPTGEISLICNELPYQKLPEKHRISTISQSIEKVEDKAVRNLYSDILNRLKEFHIDLRPRANDKISGFYEERRILKLYPRKKFIRIKLKKSDGTWTNPIKFKNNEDWENFLTKYLKPRIEKTKKR